MLAYIGKRLLATIPVMAVVAVFVFALLRLTPGDPAAIIAGSAATSQDVAEIRAKLGLDRPIVAQFFVWIGNMAHRRLRRVVLLQEARWPSSSPTASSRR